MLVLYKENKWQAISEGGEEPLMYELKDEKIMLLFKHLALAKCRYISFGTKTVQFNLHHDL